MRQTTEKPENMPLQNGGHRGRPTKMDRQTYTSVAELRAMKPKFASHVQGHSHGGASWLGVGSTAEVAEILDHGWKVGLERVRKALAKLSLPVLPSIRRHKVRADFGDEIDMQRVYSGNLAQAWGATKRRIDPRKKATPTCVGIVVRLGGNCGTSAEQLFWQGAAAVALVDMLKKSGRACKLTAFYHGSDSSADGTTECMVDFKVVEPGQQPDLEKLASTLCLAGFFRTEIFKAICNMPIEPSCGLGCSTQGVPSILKKEVGEVVEVTGIYDEGSAQRFLENVTKKF